MSHNNNRNPHNKRLGSALEHGKAHTNDHSNWSRRSFLMTGGLFAAGASLMFGKVPVRAAAPTPLAAALSSTETDRVLVLIRLSGGNDGLNTIVPIAQYGTYQTYRPTIAIPTNEIISLTSEWGMPNTMSALETFWNEDKMKVLHNVGYPNQNLSHFRSSDIWASASDYNDYENTGWLGRFLENEYPSYFIAPPSAPPAIQIGTQSNLIFRGGESEMGLVINDPNEFYQIAQTGQLYNSTDLPDCHYGNELGFIRDISNSSYRFSDSIKNAYDDSLTNVVYPSTGLAERLAIVARLIKGNLSTKIYMVSIGGFDTHANQSNSHPNLMNDLSESISAFYNDLSSTNHNEKVLISTFSEFGRRVEENGSMGTDHGAGAPVMMFGDGIDASNFIGNEPDLVNLEGPGNLIYDLDFRSIYATILQDWLCLDPIAVDGIMGQNFTRLPLVNACTPPVGSNETALLFGHEPDVNNIGYTTIKYAVLQDGMVRLQILNQAGQAMVTLENEFKQAGSYKYSFKVSDHGIPGGQYIYRVDNGGKTYSRPILAF